MINWERGIAQYFEEKKLEVTVGIPTKGRYDTLVHTLLSIALQTVKPKHVIIVDDNPEKEVCPNIWDIEAFGNIAQIFREYQITFEVVWGRRIGQHHSHYIIQDKSQTPLIWRIDDDEIAEPTVIEKLVKHFENPKVGAVGGLVIVPPTFDLPPDAQNTINTLEKPNLQWYKHRINQVIEVEHLTSSFMYRKGIAKFELHLSPAAHREDTLFSYEIKRKGFNVLVDTSTITWHLRSPKGGIRSHQDVRMWEDDDKLFADKLSEWGVCGDQVKYLVIDGGLGDQFVLKSLLPELKAKHKNLIISCCNNEVFADEGIPLISIAEAQMKLGNIDRYNIYRRMIDWNVEGWKDSLENAFRRLYDLPARKDTSLPYYLTQTEKTLKSDFGAL